MKKILVLMSIALLMIACSDSPKRFRIGIIKSSIDHLPLSFAYHQGKLPAKHYELIEFSSGWELQEALVGKHLDMGIMPFTYAYNAVDKRFPLRIVSFFERETDGILATKDLKNSRDLDGKKVGVLRASSLDVLLEKLTRDLDISIEKVFFRTANEMEAAMRRGELSAIVLYVPLVQKLEPEYKVLHWFSEDYPQHPCCDIVVNKDLMKDAKLERMKELYRVLETSCEVVNRRDPVLMSFVRERYHLSEAQAEDALDHALFQMGLDADSKLFELEMIEMMISSGYQENRVPADLIYWDIWR